MKDYKSLLEKFWQGHASDTEKLQLYKIVVEDEASLKAALQEEFEAEEGAPLSPEVSRRILESLHQEIGVRASKSIEMPRKPWGLVRWAAAVLAIVFVSVFSWKSFVVQDRAKDKNSFAANMAVIDNNTNDIRNVLLEDGTAIRLYPKGSLQFKQPFNKQSIRSITLKGKANFMVKHDALKPFEVIANNIRTTDIGTEFCIDASDVNAFKVTLKEGSIRVASMPNSSIHVENSILKPGDVLNLNFVSKNISVTQVISKHNGVLDMQHATATEKERLVFDKTPLNLVFTKLEARERVQIRFTEEEIKELTFTGVIEPTDNIETILRIICNLNGLDYRKTKQVFIIAKNK